MNSFIKAHYVLILKLVLTIYALYSLKYLFFLKNIESEFYMNLSFIFTTAGVYLLISCSINMLQQGIEKKLLIIASCMGLYFSLAAVIGTYYEGITVNVEGFYPYKEVADFTFAHFIMSLQYLPGLVFLFFSLVIFIFKKIPQLYNNYISSHSADIKLPKIFNSIYIVWLIIFICWLPYFILLYPGYIFFDSNWQLTQAATGEFNAWHPVFTTLIYSFILLFYKIFNNGVLSLAVFVVLFQMIPLSFSFAYMITKLKAVFNVSNTVFILLILFAAVFPANPLTAIIIEKNALFLLFFILFFTEFINLVYNTDLLKNKIVVIRFVLLCSILCLTRNNVSYGLVFALPFMLYIAKGYRKNVIFLFSSIFILFLVFNGIMIKATNAAKGPTVETLALPIQQIARVYKYHKESLSENELKYIESLNSKKQFSKYHPKIADYAKHRFKSDIFFTKEGLTEYIKLGIKYPATYLNSVLIMTDTLWYPFNNSLWRGGIPSETYDNKYINVTEEDLFKHKDTSFHEFVRTMHVKDNHDSMFVFISLNQSIFFYVLVISFIYFIYTKSYKNAFILLMPLGYTATLLFGPVIYLRYTYYLILIFPVIVVMLMNIKNKETVS